MDMTQACRPGSYHPAYPQDWGMPYDVLVTGLPTMADQVTGENRRRHGLGRLFPPAEINMSSPHETAVRRSAFGEAVSNSANTRQAS